jgi:hypothetical protein
MVADVRNRGERAGRIAFAPTDIGQRVRRGCGMTEQTRMVTTWAFSQTSRFQLEVLA